MSKISDILNNTAHRPWDYPSQAWVYYQEWNKALFLHWEVQYNDLRALIPSQLTVDTFKGKCYISIVGFTMQKIRPRYLPSLKLVSDFHEVNVRTYVEYDGKKGVYFLNIEAEKWLSAFIAKALSGLPYQKSKMVCTQSQYTSYNTKKNFSLNTQFSVLEIATIKNPLEIWLTERYCLYLDINNKIYRYEIHHKEWEIRQVKLDHITVDYKIGNIYLNENNMALAHYSNGVAVVSWGRERL